MKKRGRGEAKGCSGEAGAVAALPFVPPFGPPARQPLDTSIPVLPLCTVTCRFSDAIGAGRISAVEAIDNCCVLAAVGQQMASRKGVSATLFGALAKANINIRWEPLDVDQAGRLAGAVSGGRRGGQAVSLPLCWDCRPGGGG